MIHRKTESCYGPLFNLCILILNTFQKILINVFIFFFSENCKQNSELLYSPVPKCLIENVIPTILENQQDFNYEQNNFNPQLHSKDIKHEIKLPSITTLHIVLSQFVLVLFYYDLGFLFGNVSNII